VLRGAALGEALPLKRVRHQHSRDKTGLTRSGGFPVLWGRLTIYGDVVLIHRPSLFKPKPRRPVNFHINISELKRPLIGELITPFPSQMMDIS
jgi:hypothetical protein